MPTNDTTADSTADRTADSTADRTADRTATNDFAVHNVDVTLHSPGELLASVPALLGFHPVDSLVVLGLCGPRSTTIGIVLRVDLPPASRARELAEQLRLPLAQHGTVGITLIVVGGQGRKPDDDLPHRELLARCESLFVDSGMPVIHQLWTPDTAGGRRWYCYDESDCTGVLSDPGDTDLAAVAAEAGHVTYDKREDIEATLLPEPDDVLARRSASLETTSARTGPNTVDAAGSVGTAGSTPSPIPALARFGTVRAAMEAAAASPPSLSDEDVVRLANALADHRIRDICLDFDDLPDVVAAERLWTALARATPAPERAEAACLLAFSAYARGDGVLAGIALGQAEKADPGHRLSQLLRSALTIGLSPGKMRVAGIRAATYAKRSLTQEATSTGAPPVTWQPPATRAWPTPDPPSATNQSPSADTLHRAANQPLPAEDLRSSAASRSDSWPPEQPTAEVRQSNSTSPAGPGRMPTAERLLMGDLS
jgi:hypothetical protein